VVQQRSTDGYINATELCKAANKRWHNYVRQETTGHFLRALAAKTRISVLELNQEVRVGGVASTWVHPKVALHLAQWLSADFAVQVSEWVYDWMSGKREPSEPAPLPYHLARYVANDAKIPGGYFSILQECSLGLIGPLHNLGFEIPKGWVPDISLGRMFCKHLRDTLGVDTDSFEKYEHDYQDHRPLVMANLYPDEYLAAYRTWFRLIWLPQNGMKYFKGKDPSSLVFLDKLPALAAPTAKKRLS